MTTNDIVTGLHHITVIAGDPQENLDFYVGVMGMRFVKKSVNQDAPGTYHLFYADGEAHAGTDLTFFPWPDMGPGVTGAGQTVEVALAIPQGTLPYWMERLGRAGVAISGPVTRFGEQLITFQDPHGLNLALVETADPREFTPWAESPVPADRQVLGLHGARLLVREGERSVRFLVDGLGFREIGTEDGWRRFAVGAGGSGRVLDLEERPGERRGAWGRGSVHHIAWRVPDDDSHVAVQRRVANAHRSPTEVIDRFWFKSIYFKEPGGALFEVATDGPGFTVDEPLESLGETLVLPPWLEPRRGAIEAGLQPLREPKRLGSAPAGGAS